MRRQRCFATDDHIGNLRYSQALGDHPHFILGTRRLDKNHVGTGLDKRLRPVERCLNPVNGPGIGAGDDHRIRILAGIHRSLYLRCRLLN